MPKLLDLTHKHLGWPKKEDIINPKGAGPQIIAELAKRKIETAIKRRRVDVSVGILATNPLSNRTEDPLAIVCDFTNHISEEDLRETHRLAWSFSRSPMLITIEPSLLRVWTCWKRPEELDKHLDKLCVEKIEHNLFVEESLSEQAAKALQWVELTSGNFFRKPEYSKYFRRDHRADQLMLNDLKAVRQKLRTAKLPEDICHDLLARIIFVEFLFQRKDSQGRAALDEDILKKLNEKKILSKVHKDLPGILETHEETYRFFRELNNRFNGDLFPGKGKTEEEREKEWKAEMDEVKDGHLQLLAEFVRGQMDIATGQRCLWRKYAFDAIPLEFISSIYEEFVSGKKEGRLDKAIGVHYTPGHVVDLILDEVLPWNGQKCDVKILDPACGSGIFLVKAYQRLIHRWKRRHGKPSVGDLRRVLKESLFGVDTSRNAVRVASFSLYLAMCDEIDPKHVWQKNVQFPRLRDERLIKSDFFAEDKEGFRTSTDKGVYDLVIGNAPWGYATETEAGRRWAKLWNWSIPNRNIGPLFLCKSAALLKVTGKIAMLQPAGTMLFNRHSTAKRFREKLFSQFAIEKIINLAALRFGLFKAAVSPACVVIMRPASSSEYPIAYICPKAKHTKEDDYRVVVEPSDKNIVYPEEARDPSVWTVLAWGSRRDLSLIRRLRGKSFSTISHLEDAGLLRVGNGFKRKSPRPKEHPESLDLPVLESFNDWNKLPIVVSSSRFLMNNNPMFERFRDLQENYSLPLLIIKESWTVEANRFKGVLVKTGNEGTNKLLFSQSFNGIRSLGPDGYDINTIALVINSILAVYYFLLTGARMGSYRPTLLLDDIRDLPLPKPISLATNTLETITESAIDERVKEAYGLKDAEWVLVEDLFNCTLKDFKEGKSSPGRKPTSSMGEEHPEVENESILKVYCDYFSRVLRAGFGKDRQISATIFKEESRVSLPVRLVAIHFDSPGESFIHLENIDSYQLIKRLKKLDAKFLKSQKQRVEGGIFYQRVARVYDSIIIDGQKVPTVFIVKPDQVRYWTRSMAMRDADEVAGDIVLWQEKSVSKRKC
ncbi:MAG: SAM-dependent DNA methyltransferase [Sedimentisphaerales bacterium]|nr:SAM-dependent DNA methyltransferase [Sedimentisphaerales bacterium]